ncbi:hypothetical protein Hanom_Chr14g01290331 [Helianthus anomalus]
MSKLLFLKIAADIEGNLKWFRVGMDGQMKRSFTPIKNAHLPLNNLQTVILQTSTINIYV